MDLRLDCVEEVITDHDAKVHRSRLWVDPENDILIDFDLYAFLDQAEVNQTVLINDQLFTVVKVENSTLVGFSNEVRENRDENLPSQSSSLLNQTN